MMMKKASKIFPFPGVKQAMDGNTAVIMCERESTDGAGAYPITPSTQMGEYWAEERSKGHINISGRPLIFIEPEGEHAAAAVTAGLSMTGLRASNFSSGQGIAYMHESLYAAVGKRLPYILNVGCRAITKASLNVHAGHDDYHAVDDTGFFQVMAKSAQEACDLNIIAHKIAEHALTPGIVGQDGFLTTHLIESLLLPERALIDTFLGRPEDIIETPTPAQRLVYGPQRRRIPTVWDVDNPLQSGTVQNQDAYMQAVAAQRPFFFDHLTEITEEAMEAFYQLTGRQYQRVSSYRTDDADYLIVAQGSVLCTAEAVADYLRKTRKLKIGVINITMFRPFPGELVGTLLKGRKGVVVLERTDQPLAEDLPLIREIRASLSKCTENFVDRRESLPHPAYPAFNKPGDMPPLYSASFGLGSRDLQPEGIIGAVENMLPDGEKKKFFYLSVDFLSKDPDTPKQEIYQDQLREAYPEIGSLSLKGSENPNLMPEGCITVRLHSVGGWGAITTGKNLALTLYELLDYHIKANPKYGSEKKGQPTTYYLSAAPEPIRVNSEYIYVDVVLSPDPNVFKHSNPLNGLTKGGVFIIQSDTDDADLLWRSLPFSARQYITDNEIRVFFVDAFKIAREEASDIELQFRMQGNAFQGAFFAASKVMESANLNRKSLFQAIRNQMESKFGTKGRTIVEDNMRVVTRGFDETREITDKPVILPQGDELRVIPAMPILLRQQPTSSEARTDIHRFWEQTGNFYSRGKGSDNLVDPHIGLSLVPAATGVFRDMTQIRFEYPEWIADNCTACGDCYTVCPDSAIPGLVNTVSEVFETTVRRVERQGVTTKHLRRGLRTVEKKLRTLISEEDGPGTPVRASIDQAIDVTLNETVLEVEDKQLLEQEFNQFRDQLVDFQFSITKPYWSVLEKRGKGSGGLFSITVNPYTCKGCMECVSVCDDDALVTVTQTEDAVASLKKNWEYWLDLPTTSPQFSRIDDLDEKIGALETLLLNKQAYDSMICGDGACLGCGEKTVIHLFTATMTTLMQPRVRNHIDKIDDLINRLDNHIRLQMAKGMDLGDTETIQGVISNHQESDLTLSELSSALEHDSSQPLDSEWVQWVTQLLNTLKHLRWLYTDSNTNQGRSAMGIVNATGCTSVWGSTFPYNPYPFPWTSHLFQDSPSVAMGLFEGHMVKMAEGFKAIRMAELELEGKYNPKEHDPFFTMFDWRQFSEEEFLLCPPVVSIGGDGAMYDIGFQNLSRMMMSGMPIKVLVLDTQVYSNTGGQACTSGFISQVADMTPYGSAQHGKEEIRKEMSLIGMAHRTSYVLQGSISNITHLLEGYIDGLNSRRPALFNIYSVCQPEHGVGDDASELQSKMAVESRAYPLLRFDPDSGETWEECIDLEGNPALDDDWPVYSLTYKEEEGSEQKLELPFTFADFAVTEGRFRKQFRIPPKETWDDENMIPLVEFLDLESDDREDLIPYIWTIGKKNELVRVVPSAELVASTEERRHFWRQLKSISGINEAVDADQIANTVRMEMIEKISSGLVAMTANGNASQLSAALAEGVAGSTSSGLNGSTPASTDTGFEPVWIETSECTTCDECIDINPKIFSYDDQNLAYVLDPQGGSYKDIVRAAEKCTAGCIHPGTPFNSVEKGVDKLIKRAAKFQ